MNSRPLSQIVVFSVDVMIVVRQVGKSRLRDFTRYLSRLPPECFRLLNDGSSDHELAVYLSCHCSRSFVLFLSVPNSQILVPNHDFHSNFGERPVQLLEPICILFVFSKLARLSLSLLQHSLFVPYSLLLIYLTIPTPVSSLYDEMVLRLLSVFLGSKYTSPSDVRVHC